MCSKAVSERNKENRDVRVNSTCNAAVSFTFSSAFYVPREKPDSELPRDVDTLVFHPTYYVVYIGTYNAKASVSVEVHG